MKTLVITIILSFLFLTVSAQGTYTTGSSNSVPSGNMPPPPQGATPGNPTQAPQLDNGTTPMGQPNRNGSYSVTVPSSSGGYPSSTGTNPINPGAVSPTTPSPSTFPSSPGAPGPNKLVNQLYQDPMRTPKAPAQSGPVETVDGSTGKYKSHHHVVSAKKNGFTSHRRTKGVKSRASREKTSSKTSE